MIISIDTDETFDKIQHSFIIKILNVQKLIAFLYTSNEQFENKIKKTTSFPIAYLDINLTFLKYKFNKIVQYRYTENYKIFLKKFKI